MEAPPPSSGGPSGELNNSNRSTGLTPTRSAAVPVVSLHYISYAFSCSPALFVFLCPPLQDSPEFDLVFDNAVDQWVASSSADKCIFVQILYHACQTHWEGKAGGLGKSRKLGKASQQGRVDKCDQELAGAGHPDTYESKNLQARRKSFVLPKHTEFINCQSKLTQGSVSWLLRL